MAYVNDAGSRNDSSSFVFSGQDSDWYFGHKPYSSRDECMRDWMGRGYDPAAARCKWVPLPGESAEPPPDTGSAISPKPPARGEDEIADENYRGYILYKTSSGWYHLYSDWKEDGGQSLGLYPSLAEAEAGADADVNSELNLEKRYEKPYQPPGEEPGNEVPYMPTCQRGAKYPKPSLWPLQGCDAGYVGQIGGDDCYCEQAPGVIPAGIEDVPAYEKAAAASWEKYIPVAVLGFFALLLVRK